MVAFNESHQANLLKPISGKEGKEWDVVLIRPGWSKNGKYYPPDVLKTSASLFEGARAYIFSFGDRLDHLPDEIDVQLPNGAAGNVIGFYKNVRYASFRDSDGSQCEGLVAKMCIHEGAEWLRKALRDSWLQGKYDLMELSINADGDVRDGSAGGRFGPVVQKITEVKSVDIVSEGAAGGGFTRLAASVNHDHDHNGINNQPLDEAVLPFKDLALADRGRAWDSGAARRRVRQWATDGGEVDVGKYGRAFVLVEGDRQNLTSYKLPLADVVDGRLTAVPRGIFAAGAVLQGARGGVKATQEDMAGARSHVGKYFKKMDLIPPWERNAKESSKEISMQEFYSLLKEKMPRLLEGHGVPSGTEDLKDYLLRVLESSADLASEQIAELPAGDEKKLLEVAVDMQAMRKLAAMISEGKKDEALAFLRELASGGQSGHRDEDEPKKDSKESIMTEPKNEAVVVVDDGKEKELAIRETRIRVREKVMESGLPTKAQDRIVKLLASSASDLKDEEIDKAIEEERSYIDSLNESSGKPEGLGDAHDEPKTNIEIVKESYEKIVDRWQGFFEGDGLPVNGNMPFTSLREAYVEITQPKRYIGTIELAHETFRGIRAAFPDNEWTGRDKHIQTMRESWSSVARKYGLKESVTSSTFSVSFSDVINQRIQKEYTDEPRNDWGPIVSVNENANDFTNPIRINRIGGFDDLPVVAEGAAYQEITPIRTENSESISPKKRGGLEKLTLEAVLADKVGVIRRIPKALSRSEARTISKEIWNLIESNATTADSTVLIDGTTSSHFNQVSGDPTLSYASLVAAIELLRGQIEQDSNEIIGLRPAWLIVGRKLASSAFEIVESDVKATTAEDSTLKSFIKSQNIKVLSTLGVGRTTSTDDHWWLATSVRDSDTIAAAWLGGKRTPEVFVQSPSDTPTAGEAFTADVMTFKIRSNYVGTTLIDHRWIVGSLK